MILCLEKHIVRLKNKNVYKLVFSLAIHENFESEV